MPVPLTGVNYADEDLNPDQLDESGLPLDEDMQLTSAPPVPPQIAPPVQPPDRLVAQPPAVPPMIMQGSAGAIPRASRPPVNQAPGGFNMELWREQNANVPIAQAEEALGSALRFQAVRQYQQDIAAGKSPAEAMARSAPLMFYGPKTTLGQAAQFMRASAPPGMTPYQQAEIALRQRQESNSLDLAEARSIMSQIAKVESELDDMALDDKGLPAKRAKLQFLQEQLKALRQRSSTPPQALPGVPRAPSPTIQGPRTTPPPVAPAAPADSTPRVTSKQQFDALPPGTVYIGTNGRRYRKP